MNKRLTDSDWIELYYALEKKHADVSSGLYGKDSRWAEHLQNILDKIGPDGKHMWRTK